jgi:integrase
MRKRLKGKKHFYYYDTGGKPRKEIPLGSDYAIAIQKWSEIEIDADPKKHASVITFRYAAERYLVEILPKKALRTQKDNHLQLASLYKFFDSPPVPLDEIEPQNIRQYLDWRGKTSKTQANREKALLSHIWNCSREWGYTAKPNPCAGVKGHKETSRDVYVADEEFAAIYKAASEPIKDFMDLLYLTGQRPSDVLKMTRHDIKDGVLHIKQGKTKTTLRMSVEGELKAVMDRIAARNVTSLRLVVAEDGQPLTLKGMQARFAKLGANFQLRDLRAKAGTDKAEDSGDARQAQKQLGHSTITMTETYLRSRGEKVKPTK